MGKSLADGTDARTGLSLVSPAGQALLGEVYAALWTNQGAEIVRNTQPNNDRYRRSKAHLSTVVEFEGAGGRNRRWWGGLISAVDLIRFGGRVHYGDV